MAIGLLSVVGIVALGHRKKPRMMEVKITELGIEYGGNTYAFHDIQAFWIIYKPPYTRSLYLRMGRKRSHTLHIELNDQNPSEVRKLLIKELPEIEGATQPALDILSRLLRLS